MDGEFYVEATYQTKNEPVKQEVNICLLKSNKFNPVPKLVRTTQLRSPSNPPTLHRAVPPVDIYCCSLSEYCSILSHSHTGNLRAHIRNVGHAVGYGHLSSMLLRSPCPRT